jgi:hypothetical protein
MRRGKRADVPSSVLAAGPLAHDRRLGALSGARVRRDLCELGPAARVKRGLVQQVENLSPDIGSWLDRSKELRSKFELGDNVDLPADPS